MRRMGSFLLLLLIVILPIEVKALSVSKNNLTIDKGGNQTVDLYVNVTEEISEVNFSLVYTSYDVPAYFNVASGFTATGTGIKQKVKFPSLMTGKIKLGTVVVSVVANPKGEDGAVNIHTASAVNSLGENIKLDKQMINVKINSVNQPNVAQPKEDDSDTNLLSGIESEIVDIKLEKDVFDYTVSIEEDIFELDLKPILVDSKYEVEISNQKVSELVDDKIVITVKNGKKTEEYKIKVNVIEKEEVEIDNSEFESDLSYKGKFVFLIIVFGVALFAGLILSRKK